MAHNNAITPEPAPRRTDSPTVWPLIIRDLSALDAPDWLKQVLADDMRARDEFGRQKYGTPLQVENGRRAAVDAYQEALDLCAYTRQRAEQTRLGFWICAAQGAVNVAIAILHQMRLEAEGEG